MKKRHFLGLALSIFSLLVTSCSNLLPNMSRNRRSSSNIDEQSSVDYDNTSSQHRHNWSGWYLVREATCIERGLEQRECTVCGQTEQRETQYRDHTWSEGEMTVAPTCTEGGNLRTQCLVCGMIDDKYVPPYGHDWSDWNFINAPTCTEPGYGTHYCLRCNVVEDFEIPPTGHDFVEDYYQEPEEGMAPVHVKRCTRCAQITLNFNIKDVNETCNGHLVYEDDASGDRGARFWGRPIGNDVYLNENGDPDANNHEPIFNEAQTGDFFEYHFVLTEEQANMLSNCYLYCDAKPAPYMRMNGMDFFARRQSDEDWTPGFYIDGDRYGEMITDYRYCLYVDSQVVYFDPDIKNPVNSDERSEFILPYKFSLHAGHNSFRLHMAGGYRSAFYNFTFKPINSEEEWIIDNTMPAPKEGEALVKRYHNAFDHRVKYVVDVATANMTLAEGSAWKNNPETGSFKLSKNENSCSFTFSINQAFECKAYQVGYMDSYSANMQRPLYYQNTDQPNIEFKVNDVVVDLSKFKETKFQDVFGNEVNGGNSYVKEVEIGDVFLNKSNTIVFKRLYSYNLTISQFVFIGEEHDNHDFTVNEKLPDSPLRPMTCSKCGATGYELELLDSNETISPIKLKQDVTWNVTGIEPGTYEVHLNACARNTTLIQDIVSGGVGRYSFRFDNDDYISPASGKYESYGFGEGEALEYCKWTQTLCVLEADSLTSEFSIHYGNQGYSAFISGVRLVKVA